MTKVDENIKSAQNLLSGIVERCHELEEENKKLKEERDELKKEFQQYKEHYNIEKDKQQIFLMTGLRY